ncbi:MAG: hypothetical protein U0235_23430 [Polyangiaceae bacterium]
MFAEADDGILVAAELGIAEDQALRCIADALNGTPAQFQERQGASAARPFLAVTTARMLPVGLRRSARPRARSRRRALAARRVLGRA